MHPLFNCVFCHSMLEYTLQIDEMVNFTSVRTVRVLRPLRAINRVPSKCETNFGSEFLMILKELSFFLQKLSTYLHMRTDKSLIFQKSETTSRNLKTLNICC